ncbi:MAG: response regulator transcription factor [Clostridiales bacterium]|jgi:DNA-binding response OmpR family regulator|nr:response regulator transcription factor [Clostridiales bacterium]
METFTILVADDDAEIRRSLCIYLTHEGMRCVEAADGIEALRAIEEQAVHLILMDLMMPRMDGVQAILNIRKERGIPVIILSAKSEDADIILGLNIGADDYITKPFHFPELVARVKANLRRYAQYENFKREEDALSVRGLTLNTRTKEVYVDNVPAKLTPIEFKILRLLMANRNAVFSIDEIYERVWGDASLNGADNTVAVHIRRIREKIEPNPKNPMYIKVVWGIGYKIES